MHVIIQSFLPIPLLLLIVFLFWIDLIIEVFEDYEFIVGIEKFVIGKWQTVV